MVFCRQIGIQTRQKLYAHDLLIPGIKRADAYPHITIQTSCFIRLTPVNTEK